ncbi:MAG: hypothetical protein GF334_03555 [Candidatus Altiarchaeales archaeon]|nr:hypothetical protein [Candidatus Altiarchaeales archaeon]
MDEHVERSLSRIFGDIERGHRIRKIRENAGLGVKTFLAGVVVGVGVGFGLSNYIDSPKQSTHQMPEVRPEKPAVYSREMRVQVPVTLREPSTDPVWEPDVRNKLKIRRCSDPWTEIPPNYAKVPTSSGKSYLVPLEFNKIDSTTIPDEYTLMVKDKTPVLAEERDVESYTQMGYQKMFKRLKPVEPPKYEHRTRRRLR